VKFTVTFDGTVDIPESELEALEYDTEDFDEYDLQCYVEEHSNLTFDFGEAWITGVDTVDEIGL
jgi:hypothetical protein